MFKKRPVYDSDDDPDLWPKPKARLCIAFRTREKEAALAAAMTQQGASFEVASEEMKRDKDVVLAAEEQKRGHSGI